MKWLGVFMLVAAIAVARIVASELPAFRWKVWWSTEAKVTVNGKTVYYKTEGNDSK